MVPYPVKPRLFYGARAMVNSVSSGSTVPEPKYCVRFLVDLIFEVYLFCTGIGSSVAEPEAPGAGADFFWVGAGSRSRIF